MNTIKVRAKIYRIDDYQEERVKGLDRITAGEIFIMRDPDSHRPLPIAEGTRRVYGLAISDGIYDPSANCALCKCFSFEKLGEAMVERAAWRLGQ